MVAKGTPVCVLLWRHRCYCCSIVMSSIENNVTTILLAEKLKLLMSINVCWHNTLPNYRHYRHLFEDTELLKCLSSVYLMLGQFSQLSFMQYMRLCVSSVSIALMMIVRTCVLCLIIFIKSEVWPVCHCLTLGHETMVGAHVFLYCYSNEWLAHVQYKHFTAPP